jgi:hypothetical protein
VEMRENRKEAKTYSKDISEEKRENKKRMK